MSKIVGIVAELNPLHNGHKYIIDYARNELNADYIVMALSGDFVQRGEPAIFNKYVRTKAALMAGVDAVFQLPVQISTASAQYYALGSVSLLDKLGCDTLLFGSENGDLNCLNNSTYEKGVIDTPNNILGREYINAINNLNLSIQPYTIARIGTDYHNTDSIINDICSASFIRANFNKIFLNTNIKSNKILYDNNNINKYNDSNTAWDINSIMPTNVYDLFNDYLVDNIAIFPDSFSEILLSKLVINSAAGYHCFFDIFDDLSEKLLKNMNSYTSFSSFADLLKSKDITRSHISRALLNICLDTTKEDFKLIKSLNYSPYARLLGFNKDSQVLNAINQKTRIDIISKLSDYINSCNESQKILLHKDINASHIYSFLATGKVQNELQKKLLF